MIQESAVEAAARALAQPAPYDFESYPQHWMQRALRAIEAAAPYMLAQAWDEGYTLGYADCANKQESNRPNPYMLNNEGEK